MCRFAKQNGIPMVPVMVVDQDQADWKASGWLGIVTAGCLWTPLSSDFERSADDIVQQIKAVVPKETMTRWESIGHGSWPTSNMGSTLQPEVFSKTDVQAETIAELSRLKSELDAATNRGKHVVAGTPMFDPDLPAEVPTPVPQLPRDFQETVAIRELRKMLTTDSGPQRVGFWCVFLLF
jgi:hypothetical protein